MTPEVINDILIPILTKLDSLPNGTSISLSELIRKTFECKFEYIESKGWQWVLDNGTSFFDDELFDLLEPFEKAVHKAGYRIYQPREAGMVMGLPYNLNRIYRRKDTQILK